MVFEKCLVEGNAIRSCLVLAVQADEQSNQHRGCYDFGRSGELSIVQDAFARRTAFNAVIAHGNGARGRGVTC